MNTYEIKGHYETNRDIEIDPEHVKHLFNYDPSTGLITRRNWTNPKFEGREAFTSIQHNLQRTGYLFGRSINASHVAWVISHGKWPRSTVYYIDGNRQNNRIDNLSLTKPTKSQTGMTNDQLVELLLEKYWFTSDLKYIVHLKYDEDGNELDAPDERPFQKWCDNRKAYCEYVSGHGMISWQKTAVILLTGQYPDGRIEFSDKKLKNSCPANLIYHGTLPESTDERHYMELRAKNMIWYPNRNTKSHRV